MKLALASSEPAGSWAFWKARLARACLVGALFFAAAQVLPTLPQDQTVEVQLSAGKLREVRLTYLEDSTALAGASVKPGPRGDRIRHTARLKDGDYEMSVDAFGEDSAGKPRTWHHMTKVRLTGEPVTIRLD